MTTWPVGTTINGGTFTIPDALAGKTFHLFGDFLMLDVRTGDGIVIAIEEHYARNWHQIQWKNLSLKSFVSAQNKVGTAPLYGVRQRPQLMHDGRSVALRDAIWQHLGEASEMTGHFRKLKQNDQEALIVFLRWL